jgi:hypothetical protein
LNIGATFYVTLPLEQGSKDKTNDTQ